MTKKIQLFTLTLCLSLLGFVNTAKAVTYHLKAGGVPSTLTDWGTLSSGAGSHPATFTHAGDIFYLNANTTNLTFNGTWTLGSVQVYVGKLTGSSSGLSFTIQSGATITGGSFNTKTGTTLYVQCPDLSGIGGFNVNSGTVVYNGGIPEVVIGASYNNLTIAAGTTGSLNGLTAVGALLTLSSASDVLVFNGNELDINGTFSGSGTLTGDTAGASLIVGLSAAVFPLNFTNAAGALLSNLTIGTSAAATCTVTLNNDLIISNGGNGSFFDMTGGGAPALGGSVNLNGHKLTLGYDNTTTLSTSASNVITGSSTSSLVFNNDPGSGGVITNSLYIDQTTVGTTNNLSNLTMNSTGQTLTLANALNVIDSICPTSGTLAGGGNVTLIADQVTVGHVGRIGMVTGTFSGNIISQVYHDPTGNQTNWVLMGVAGITGANFTSWNNAFQITCTSCPDGNGSGANNGTPFTSIDSYSESAATGDPNAMAHYVGISNTTDALNLGSGYWIFMGATEPSEATQGELISVTGAPQIGNFGWTLTNSNGGAATDGYNSLANPYASPISWTKLALRNSNAITTYYAYNSVTQAYSTYMVGGSTTTSGSYALTDVIPAGLGFYVQTFAGSLPFNIQEGDKTAGNQIIGRMANPNQVQSVTPSFNLVIEGANANLLHEEAAISFNPNSTNGLDAYDAIAFPWNGVLQITTASQGYNFAINGMPGLTQNYAIPVKILSGTTTQYTISTKNLQNIPAGACVKLHDNYNVIPDQDLHAGAFTVTINDSETVARFVLNITITPLAITTNTVSASCHVKNDGSITAVGNDAGPWNYIWKNASGTIVKTSLNKATADTLTGLNNGVYSVDVSTVGSCNSATQTFTLTAPAAAVSAFTASSQVNTGDNVVLTNNSANATNYVWSFGDGDVSSMQTPNYVYNNAGTYTITLQAINANCNDTATSTQVITVNATASIKQANAGDGNINLSRDASGNYIQFDYTNQTKVSITVYNVLGQVVLNDAELSVVNDKIYININDNKNQVLYVNITNLNTNKQTTKKFVND